MCGWQARNNYIISHDPSALQLEDCPRPQGQPLRHLRRECGGLRQGRGAGEGAGGGGGQREGEKLAVQELFGEGFVPLRGQVPVRPWPSRAQVQQRADVLQDPALPLLPAQGLLHVRLPL